MCCVYNNQTVQCPEPYCVRVLRAVGHLPIICEMVVCVCVCFQLHCVVEFLHIDLLCVRVLIGAAAADIVL